MSANRVNGFFNTLNVVNSLGRIRLDDDGNIRLVGSNLFLNIANTLQITSNGKLNLTSLTDDIIIDSQTGSVHIQAGTTGTTAILIDNQNPLGGISINSGYSGLNLNSIGDVNILSTGNNINIGYADNDFGTTSLNETHNVYIEANNTISGNAKYIQFISSESFTVSAPDINIGPDPMNPFLKIVDDCLLIDSVETQGIRKVLIDTDNNSLSKPSYDGLLIRSRNNNIATDLTLQTSNLNSNNLPISDLSLGVEALNTKNGKLVEIVGYKLQNVIIPLDPYFHFTKNDIGKSIFWTKDNIIDTILGVTGYITQPSISSTSLIPTSFTSVLTTSGVYSGLSRKIFKIMIDNTSTTPNKFKWSNDEGLNYQSELIDIDINTPQYLEDGIYITFTQDTGFESNTFWKFIAITTVFTDLTSPTLSSQPFRILNPGLSYFGNKYAQDLILKTSDHERLRITDNGNIGIGNSNPTATLEVTNNVGKKILLSTDYIGQQINPSVACLSNGGWVAVWESYTNGTTKYDIYCQIFYSDGTRNGNQFLVNTITLNQQTHPYVAASKDTSSNKFLIVWNSEEALNPGNYNIIGKIFNADYTDGNRAVTSEITINTSTLYNQQYPRATGLEKSDQGYNYVVVWTSNHNLSTNIDSYCQVVTGNGSLLYNEIRVNTITSLNQTYPDVSSISLNDPHIPGGFVIGYISEATNNFYNIKFQLFTFNSTKYGSETTVTSDNQKTYGRVSVKGLYSGGFIITFNESYYGDNHNFVYDPIGAKDTFTGKESFTSGILSGLNYTTPTKIQLTVSIGSSFNIGEEVTTSLSNRTEKIKNITIISPSIIEIELSRDTKVIKAAKYNTTPSQLFFIDSVNTTPFQNDPTIINSLPISTEIYNYTLPTIAETYDSNFIITWSNGFNSNIYYQKFNVNDGIKLGDEYLLQKIISGMQQKNPAITKLINKNNQDAGLVIVYQVDTLDTSFQGVYGEIINDDNSIIKVWNQNGSINFTNQGNLGIGLDTPETLLHLKSSNPSITLQNDDTTIGKNLANSKIIFKDANSSTLAEIVGCYTSTYQTRNPQYESLFRWYQFDDSNGSNEIIDSSQYNISGKLYNFDIFNDWTSGKIKKSLRFSGNQYIDCGYNSTLINSTLTAGFSVSCWVKIFPGSLYSGTDMTIISTGDILPGNFNIKINTNGFILFTVYTDTDTLTIDTQTDITDGLWHNIVVTYNIDTTQKIYLDSTLQTSIIGISSDSSIIQDTKIIIGSLDTLSQYYSGYLDDLRIYNTSLTILDVETLYNNITQTKGKVVIRTNDGISIPDDNSVKNFSIDSDGYIENFRFRSLPDTILTGTVIPTDKVVTGTSTKFLSEINVGDQIIINSISRIVTGITNDTILNVNFSYTDVLPSTTYTNIKRIPSLFTALNSKQVIRTLITSDGKMSIGNPDPSAKLVISGTQSESDYANIYLNNLTPITNISPNGGVSQIIFNGTNSNNQIFKVSQIETSVNMNNNTNLYNSKLLFNVIKESVDTQCMVLNNNGYLGLNNTPGFNPSAHLNIIDNTSSEVNVLLESGSFPQQINGGGSNIIFKSKSINNNYAKIIGSSDTTIFNSSKGRLDFITNNGISENQKLTLKSDNRIGFFLSEPVNTFQISPLLTSSNSGQTVSLSGTTVTGVNTAFTSSYIGYIIYFKVSKVSRIITTFINASSVLVSETGSLPAQSFEIHLPGFNITSNNQFGIGVSEPTSDIHMKGSMASETKTITYNDCDDYDGDLKGIYFIGNHPNQPSFTNDKHHLNTLLVDTTAGVVVIRLPPSYTCPGRIYNIKRYIGDTNNVIIDGYSDNIISEKIDYLAQWNLDAVYKSVTIQSDGVSKWNILSNSFSSGTDVLPNTDSLMEGVVNLYFTEARVRAITDALTTDNIPEGITNLYFTTDRVNTMINPLYSAINTLSISFDPVGAANLAENTSKSYTDSLFAALTTDTIQEGTLNLFSNITNIQSAFDTASGITVNNFNVLNNIYKNIDTKTQSGSQTNTVTSNGSNGIIKTASLNISPSSGITFTVNNTEVSYGDQVFVSITDTPDPLSNSLFPIACTYGITTNSFNIRLRNCDPVNTCTGIFDISYQIIKKIN